MENTPVDDMFLRIVTRKPLTTEYGNAVAAGAGEGQQQETDDAERINCALWVSTYSDDIYQTLLEDELKRRRVNFTSDQTQYRLALVQLLRSATYACKLSRCTLHLATYLLDRFMDSFTIRVDKLNLTALTCLHIAAQMEDADPNIPKYIQLNRLVGYIYDWSEFRCVERRILITLDFGLLRPTVTHFIEHLSSCFLTLEDFQCYQAAELASAGTTRSSYSNEVDLHEMKLLRNSPSYDSYEHMLCEHTKLLLQFADLTLTCFQLTNALPSVVAASCIASVRIRGGLKTRWTPRLQKITGYAEETLNTYIDILNVLYESQNSKQQDHNNKVPTTPTTTTSTADTVIVQWSSPDSGILSLQELNIYTPILSFVECKDNVVVDVVPQQLTTNNNVVVPVTVVAVNDYSAAAANHCAIESYNHVNAAEKRSFNESGYNDDEEDNIVEEYEDDDADYTQPNAKRIKIA